MSEFSRRAFVQAGVAATATAALAQTETAKRDVGSRIRAAVIGLNGRGKSHIASFEKQENVEVVALCDPDAKVMAARADDFEKKYGRKVDTAQDMRTLFDRDDIDVVSVATPNHWHALATIWACRSGKDVYVEKPGAHNLFEGRKMIEATKKYNRIVQHGVQLRSNPELQRAVALLGEGVIGQVYMARGLVFRRRGSIGNKPAESPPETFNWDLWQGPAEERDYSRRFVHYNWHWHWAYGNGDIGNQGVHETDLCLWGLGANKEGTLGTSLGLPAKISALGGKFLWDDDKETPELLTSAFHYPDEKKIIEFEVRPWETNLESDIGVGNIFYGSEGYMTISGYSSFKTYLGPKREPGPKGSAGDPLNRHFANFIQAVRSRDASTLAAPVETAHASSALAHLGNISYRLGRQLEFNPETETFVSDTEADAMLTRPYRPPFVVPSEV